MARGAGHYVNWQPEQVAELFRLRDQEKLSFAEIAERLGMSETRCSDRYRYVPGRRSSAPQRSNRSSYETKQEGTVLLACLCCSQPFQSVDRRANRLCRNCAGGSAEMPA